MGLFCYGKGSGFRTCSNNMPKLVADVAPQAPVNGVCAGSSNQADDGDQALRSKPVDSIWWTE